MRTVKEVSILTGISVRTLHWYHEIGLFNPTECSEAGYRLYDEKALEILQQILFFREFDIPLKEIKAIIENPNLNKETILKNQKGLLELKKKRLEKLLSSIDDILRGENQMDFTIFNKSEIETMYQEMISHLDKNQLGKIEEQYGNLGAFQKVYVKKASRPEVQKYMQKIVEWHGEKDTIINGISDSKRRKLIQAYESRIGSIYLKLAEAKNMEVSSFEVKQLIGELDFVMKQVTQMEEVTPLMLEIANNCLFEEEVSTKMNQKYGNGMAAFFGKALLEFYKE